MADLVAGTGSWARQYRRAALLLPLVWWRTALPLSAGHIRAGGGTARRLQHMAAGLDLSGARSVRELCRSRAAAAAATATSAAAATGRPSTATIPNAFLFQFYLGIYVVWSLSNGLFTLVYRLISAHFGTAAAKLLHSEMFSHILKAPMLFFEQTPHGRLINRFSKDTSDVDKQLVAWVIFFIATVFCKSISVRAVGIGID